MGDGSHDALWSHRTGVVSHLWKLELCSDSGGWSNPKPGSAEAKGLPDTQLYSFSGDVTEAKNQQGEHPTIVARLTKELEQIIAHGRSTPGARQANDAAIKLRKVSDTGATE